MKINEDNFVKELQKQNEKALEYIIDEYGGLIKAIVKKHMVYLQSEQEECINDILIGIWKNSMQFQPEKSSFKNWIAAIAKYKVIDYQRKYLKQIQCEQLENVIVAEEEIGITKVIEQEISQQTTELLNCLKSVDRHLFLELYVEDKDIKEVSEATGMKESLIYNRISRGKKKIKQLFHI